MTPIFIVGTGRCGSTMLSNMIRLHPDLLSISEFFTSLSSYAFRGHQMTGEAVYRRLNQLSPAGRALLGNGLFPDEFLYELGPNARYKAKEVPPILCTTLPHLTDDYERLWDELATDLRIRGQDSLAAHYLFIFEQLMTRFGKKLWLERSGGLSLLFVPVLTEFFPGARFVHIYRDARDTVLSMHKHHFFRLRAQAAERMRRLGMDPFSPFNTPGTSPWIPALEWCQFRLFFSHERYRRAEISLAACGRLWNGTVERGLAYLDALPADRVLSMRYERLVDLPKTELRRLIRFVGAEFENSRWLDDASTLPRVKTPSWKSLKPEDYQQLVAACQPGQKLLGYDCE